MSVSGGQAAVHSGACRSVGLGQNRPGARVESAGSKAGPAGVPALMAGLPHSAEPQWHIRHGVFSRLLTFTAREAGYRLGSDRGSPNHGSTLASKRVMAQIWPPARVST